MPKTDSLMVTNYNVRAVLAMQGFRLSLNVGSVCKDFMTISIIEKCVVQVFCMIILYSPHL